MRRGRQIGRPLAASMLFLAGLALGGTLLASALADLSAAGTERDAKAEFVSRSLAAGRRGGAPAGPTSDATLAVRADTETLAAARIDDLLRAAAREAGGTVLSSRAEAKADETGPPNRIETAALVEGPMEALQALLYSLESGRPMVLVDVISIQGAEASTGRDPRDPVLHATMTLSAYWTKPVR